jgi:hypothetical protein
VTTEPLDTPQSCFHELIGINLEIAGFGHLWAKDAGELKALLKREERLHRQALRQLRDKDMTVGEKSAQAAFMVSEDEPTLYERIEELEGNVEEYKVRFRAADRRASNAQSILKALERESDMQDYIYWTGDE